MLVLLYFHASLPAADCAKASVSSGFRGFLTRPSEKAGVGALAVLGLRFLGLFANKSWRLRR